jgi:hypothetical protein
MPPHPPSPTPHQDTPQRRPHALLRGSIFSFVEMSVHARWLSVGLLGLVHRAHASSAARMVAAEGAEDASGWWRVSTLFVLPLMGLGLCAFCGRSPRERDRERKELEDMAKLMERSAGGLYVFRSHLFSLLRTTSFSTVFGLAAFSECWSLVHSAARITDTGNVVGGGEGTGGEGGNFNHRLRVD